MVATRSQSVVTGFEKEKLRKNQRNPRRDVFNLGFGQSPSYLGFVLKATDFPLEYYYDYIIFGGETPGYLLAALFGRMGTEPASTNIGGPTFDSSVHRHSDVADLLNYVRSSNIRVAVYGSVESIL
ncbi:hypothetical protein LguiB_013191 [Lonicera macranthoides]